MATAYLETQAKSGEQTPYLAHVLMDGAVTLDRERLVSALNARLGRVKVTDLESGGLLFTLPEFSGRVDDTQVSVQLGVLALEGIPIDDLAAALRQSWSWPDAGEVAAHCRAHLTVSDFFGAAVDRRIRLALFHGAMSCLLEQLPVRAIQWAPSQQVISPDAYLERLATGEGLRGSALNVRRFKLSPEGDGAPLQLLDTMGLSAFGLPDLQVRFTGRGTAEVEQWLHAEAARLFDEGDRFVARGTAAPLPGEAAGFLDDTRSIAPPDRRVLEIRLP